MGQNCHDFASTGEPFPGNCFGVVLDGCGSKFRTGKTASTPNNEVGAKLLGAFLSNVLNERLAQIGAGDPDLAALAAELHQRSLAYLAALLASIGLTGRRERTRFAATHLLTTLLGYIVTPKEAVFFWCGDGYLCHDGRITRLESDNRPHYLAYELFSEEAGSGIDPPGLHMASIGAFSQTSWLAVATDGWNSDSLKQLATPRSTLALQRWLNVQARSRNLFNDDAAVATWYRESHEPSGEIPTHEHEDPSFRHLCQ
jgi:hypothetical protein